MPGTFGKPVKHSFLPFVSVGSQNFLDATWKRSKTINSFLVLASEEFSTEHSENRKISILFACIEKYVTFYLD